MDALQKEIDALQKEGLATTRAASPSQRLCAAPTERRAKPPPCDDYRPRSRFARPPGHLVLAASAVMLRT